MPNALGEGVRGRSGKTLAHRISGNLPFVLLTAFLMTLAVAGGSSQIDVSGRVVSRIAAWACVISVILAADFSQFRAVKPAFWFLAAAAVIPTIQLIPLPASLWSSLPGHDLFLEAAASSAQPQPWRPMSIVPSLTFNALSSLIVPAAAIILASMLKRSESRRMLGVLLLICFSLTLIGLVQLSERDLIDPLTENVEGKVSSTFANRNHFSLYLAIGSSIAFFWGTSPRSESWKLPISFGLAILFLLTSLATGSRSGIVIECLALGLSGWACRKQLGSVFGRTPPRLIVAISVLAVFLVAAVIAISVQQGKAIALDRLFTLDPGDDIRSLALPTTVEMAKTYFPFGYGSGCFEYAFRISEPDKLINPLIFNHAHNDAWELVLDSGILGVLFELALLIWWAKQTISIYRRREKRAADAADELHLARLGSVILLLIMLSSFSDYPCRTPLIMSTAALAMVWLARPKGDAVWQAFTPLRTAPIGPE